MYAFRFPFIFFAFGLTCLNFVFIDSIRVGYFFPPSMKFCFDKSVGGGYHVYVFMFFIFFYKLGKINFI